MDIDGISFEGMNEADVREEFVTPLLRRLGYRSGFKHNIVREQSLRYPRSSLGRKKRSDPMLRGKADYICEANGRIRWVIEAKAPSESLGIDEAEQAYTYARHPEVRAVYFCLTNGHEFVVYRTDESPDAGPVLTVDYDDFPAGFSRIESLLSPAAVVRDHPEIDYRRRDRACGGRVACDLPRPVSAVPGPAGLLSTVRARSHGACEC